MRESAKMRPLTFTLIDIRHRRAPLWMLYSDELRDLDFHFQGFLLCICYKRIAESGCLRQICFDSQDPPSGCSSFINRNIHILGLRTQKVWLSDVAHELAGSDIEHHSIKYWFLSWSYARRAVGDAAVCSNNKTISNDRETFVRVDRADLMALTTGAGLVRLARPDASWQQGSASLIVFFIASIRVSVCLVAFRLISKEHYLLNRLGKKHKNISLNNRECTRWKVKTKSC